MKTFEQLIDELSKLCGIIPEYWDIFGNRYLTSFETKKAILRAMGLRIDSIEDLNEEIKRLSLRPWNIFIEPVYVISLNNQPSRIPVYIPINQNEEKDIYISMTIVDENGNRDDFIFTFDKILISDEKWIENNRYLKIEISDRYKRDIGYYNIHITCTIRSKGQTIKGISKLIITPDSCYIPKELEDNKTWGLSINLNSLRSSNNWGIGDFSDLKKIIPWLRGLKGSFVGINPLHCISNEKPFGISPYSPISKLYKNLIYLDIEAIEEYRELLKMGLIDKTYIITKLNEIRNSNLVDHKKIALLKKMVLKQCFDLFYEKYNQNDKGTDANTLERINRFKQYIKDEGGYLDTFATYMAISKRLGIQDSELYSWQNWPEQYHNPLSQAVEEFKRENEKEITFYKYIQWLIDEQLYDIFKETLSLQMPLGIYHDLAIGSIRGGSDEWMAQDLFAKQVSIGAPPDDFNLKGQDWGLPPLIPERLRGNGYDFFIQTLRKNMKYFGALRIDHALGLFRLYWIPKGMTASEGAYVEYPSEDLLRIIALESVRNRTLIIAEDLGTIGEGVRESLLKFRMLSYRLLYFERNYPEQSFLLPDKYPETALCAVTTHDLPTIYGWWIKRDIEIKKGLGIITVEDLYKKSISDREKDKKLLIAAIRSLGIITDESITSELSKELCLAIYEYLAATPCKLLSVSLDDAIGVIDQHNLPGTINEYPNWSQKYPATIEEIFLNKWFEELSLVFAKYNRSKI